MSDPEMIFSELFFKLFAKGPTRSLKKTSGNAYAYVEHDKLGVPAKRTTDFLTDITVMVDWALKINYLSCLV